MLKPNSSDFGKCMLKNICNIIIFSSSEGSFWKEGREDDEQEGFVFFPFVNTVVLRVGRRGMRGPDLEGESRDLGPCLAMDSLGGFASHMPSSGSSVCHVN